MNLSKRIKPIVVDVGQIAGTSTVDTSSVNMTGADGVMFMASFAVANVANTIHLQESDDDSVWADLADTEATPTTNNNLVIIDINRPLKQFIRARLTRGVSTASGMVIAEQYGSAKMSTSQDTTVDAIVTLASPDPGTP